MLDKTLLIALTTLIINIPLGYWREGVKKFSVQWFMAVHAAVPLVIIMRLIAGLEWQILTITFFVVCYFLGQFIGAMIKRKKVFG